jgi:hypothetical protein
MTAFEAIPDITPPRPRPTTDIIDGPLPFRPDSNDDGPVRKNYPLYKGRLPGKAEENPNNPPGRYCRNRRNRVLAVLSLCHWGYSPNISWQAEQEDSYLLRKLAPVVKLLCIYRRLDQIQDKGKAGAPGRGGGSSAGWLLLLIADMMVGGGTWRLCPTLRQEASVALGGCSESANYFTRFDDSL